MDDTRFKHSNDSSKFIILDSTAIIHLNPDTWDSYKDYLILIPDTVIQELKSRNAQSVLSILDSLNNVSSLSPSRQSLKKAEDLAKKTGDFSKLSFADLSVIALALEFPGSIVISDDNAIQNVCISNNIPIQSKFFKVSNIRHYYWRCTVCGAEFNFYITECPNCGSPVKRRYRKKKLQFRD